MIGAVLFNLVYICKNDLNVAIRMITLSISRAHLVESDLSGKKRRNLEGEWANLSADQPDVLPMGPFGTKVEVRERYLLSYPFITIHFTRGS